MTHSYAHSFTPPAGWPYYVSHHKALTHNLSQSLLLRLEMSSLWLENMSVTLEHLSTSPSDGLHSPNVQNKSVPQVSVIVWFCCVCLLYHIVLILYTVDNQEDIASVVSTYRMKFLGSNPTVPFSLCLPSHVPETYWLGELENLKCPQV